MSYDKDFNNPLALWAAFGARGNGTVLEPPKPPDPELTWRKLYYSDFGYSSYGGETNVSVHDNGNAQIAAYYTKSPYISYYDKATKKWTVTSCTWWNNGAPEILYAGDGVFLAKMTGFGNIIASFDGITWYNGGYCTGAKGALTAGAYDVINSCGAVSFWSTATPIFYSYDSLTERTAWTMTTSSSTIKYMTAHKGLFVGIVGGNKEIAVANASSPSTWTKTITVDSVETQYMYVKSIHGKLFVMKLTYADSIYNVKLCVMNDGATAIIETNLSHVGRLADNKIPSPQNILWLEKIGKFVLFNEGMMYTSIDGITWEGKEQSGFTTSTAETFAGAIYVPEDGFYVKGNGYVYYSEYR